MIRMSALPTSKYCGLSAKLSARYGSGTPARLSSAFHAHCAGNDALLNGLTAKERQEVSQWLPPPDVVLPDGAVLQYSAAEKELEVCLDGFGQSCSPTDAISIGHLDFAWMQGRYEPAYVADIKKTRWSSVDGAESLQLHAYGTAFARMRGALAYSTGIWLPVDGEWLWSKRIIALDSSEHRQIVAEILHAATNEADVGSTGSHCSNCYARLKCPEFTLPAVLSTTALAPVTEGMVPTPEAAAKLLQFIQALDGDNGLLAKAKDQLKEFVRRGDLVIERDGKRWGPVTMPGRKGLDKALLAAEVGDLKRFEKTGASYEQFDWRKVKP